MSMLQTPVFKAVAWLLSYPDEVMVTALPDVIDAVADQELLASSRVDDLRRFGETLKAQDLIDAQEYYVGLFDRSRQVSLHLFEHVHGESRDRGMAMVNLRDIYVEAGLLPNPSELPDYLPMYLEYLSLLPFAKARQGLCDVGPILQAVHKRLAARQSHYAVPFVALLDLAGLDVLTDQSDAEPADDTPEAIDRAWEEQAVAFGPESDPQKDADCGRASAMVDRMNAYKSTTKVAEAAK
ncbi:MAG: nitrate reductase molybdenum cofactor assembly chaperone [Proteobacteria bacterium]|nr:nitrate reductase molybdenum cofactor assembly chaperone [Pseudomonadota bacterium]